jgi:hypothetical protein
MRPQSSEVRIVPTRLWRKAVLPPLAGGGFFFILGWANYISYALFNYNLLGRKHVEPDAVGGAFTGTVYLWMAIGFTVIGLGGGWWVARAHLYIMRYGRKVTGRIIGKARHSYRGMQDVVVEYEVEGVRYEHAETSSPALLDGLEVGDPVTVHVHPRRPKRAVILWYDDEQVR